MNKDKFLKLLEKAKTDKYGNLYIEQKDIEPDTEDFFANKRIYFGTISTVCDDLIEEFCRETDTGFELYDRHFINDDTLECQIVNVGKLKSRYEEGE